MPPKIAKPVEFDIDRLMAGKNNWVAGESGPLVQLNFEGHPLFGMLPSPLSTAPNLHPTRPRYEVLLLGKVLFGRGRFAFEVKEVDYDPERIQSLIDKKAEFEDDRFGPCGDRDVPGWARMQWAKDYSPKKEFHVKFDDIERIEGAGDSLTLTLSRSPSCYENKIDYNLCKMGVVKDFTDETKTITIVARSRPREHDVHGNRKVVSFEQMRELAIQHSTRLAALFGVMPLPTQPSAGMPCTPKSKKRRSDDSHAGSFVKQRRTNSSPK